MNAAYAILRFMCAGDALPAMTALDFHMAMSMLEKQGGVERIEVEATGPFHHKITWQLTSRGKDMLHGWKQGG